MKLRYFILLPALFITSILAAGPVAVCEAQVNVALPANACEITLTPAMIDAGSYDTNGHSFGRSLNGHRNLGPGYYNVVLTVYTRFGSNSCWSQVLVEDKTTPSVTCHPQTHYLVASDQPITYSTEDIVTISDNCEPLAYTAINVPDPSGYGTYTFSAYAIDNAGNTGACLNTMTIIDAEPQDYCSSSRSDNYEHISNIQLNSFSPNINQSSGADGGYNWHYPTGNNILYHGTTYTLSYTPGFRFSTYHEYWSVYIDKNADGDFTDSGELLHQWQGYGGNSFNFASPGTVWGWSRIRVVMRYGGYATSPCGGGGYGETEDISVYLRPYFFIPWPGFKQKDLVTASNVIAGQELLVLGSENPTEEALPREVEQRRQLIAPEQNSSFPTITQTGISVFPNPVRAGQEVTVNGQDEASELVLRNMTGRIVKRYLQGTTRVEVPANLPAGIYLLSGVATANGKLWTKRVVVK
jgi:hypothetical protein